MKVIGRQVLDESNEAPIASSEASAILEAEDGKENQDVNQPAKRWENIQAAIQFMSCDAQQKLYAFLKAGIFLGGFL